MVAAWGPGDRSFPHVILENFRGRVVRLTTDFGERTHVLALYAYNLVVPDVVVRHNTHWDALCSLCRPCTQVNLDTRAAFAWEGRQQRRARRTHRACRSHRSKVDLVLNDVCTCELN